MYISDGHFNPDGNLIATTDSSGRLIISNVDNGELVHFEGKWSSGKLRSFEALVIFVQIRIAGAVGIQLVKIILLLCFLIGKILPCWTLKNSILKQNRSFLSLILVNSSALN